MSAGDDDRSTNAAEKRCDRCGCVLTFPEPSPGNPGQAYCPACVLEAALGLTRVDTGEPEDGEVLPRFPGYRTLDRVGRGGSGVIWRARHEDSGRPVAIKQFGPGVFLDEDRYHRWRREIALAARLDDPRVAKIYHAGPDREGEGLDPQALPWFAMEYVEGEPLQRYLAAMAKRMTIRSKGRLWLDIVRGVAHAHRLGIVHRDLKPANILVREDGLPKVVDFGLAGSVDALRQGDDGTAAAKGFAGTIGYAAPEQLRGAPAGTAADVFALGVIGFEMFFGRHPFPAADAEKEDRRGPAARLRAIEAAGPGHPGAGLPGALHAVLCRCLQPEPAGRYDTAVGLAEDLQRWLENRPVRARPAGAAERIWLWGRRHPFTAIASAVAVLAASSVLIALDAGTRAERRFGERIAAELKRARRAEVEMLATIGADGFLVMWDRFDRQKLAELEPLIREALERRQAEGQRFPGYCRLPVMRALIGNRQAGRVLIEEAGRIPVREIGPATRALVSLGDDFHAGAVPDLWAKVESKTELKREASRFAILLLLASLDPPEDDADGGPAARWEPWIDFVAQQSVDRASRAPRVREAIRSACRPLDRMLYDAWVHQRDVAAEEEIRETAEAFRLGVAPELRKQSLDPDR